MNGHVSKPSTTKPIARRSLQIPWLGEKPVPKLTEHRVPVDVHLRKAHKEEMYRPERWQPCMKASKGCALTTTVN
jgi:hypothetical protein